MFVAELVPDNRLLFLAIEISFAVAAHMRATWFQAVRIRGTDNFFRTGMSITSPLKTARGNLSFALSDTVCSVTIRILSSPAIEAYGRVALEGRSANRFHCGLKSR